CSRAVFGNLCREQTCSRRIYGNAGSRDQEVRRAGVVGRTGLYEDQNEGELQIPEGHSRCLCGGTKALNRRGSTKHRTRRRSSHGGGSGLERIDCEVAAAALS